MASSESAAVAFEGADCGWNRLWVRDKNFFRGQGARGRIEPKDGSGLAVCGNWFRAATEERRRRTEPDLSGGEGLDDDHGPAAFGAAPKRARLLGGMLLVLSAVVVCSRVIEIEVTGSHA